MYLQGAGRRKHREAVALICVGAERRVAGRHLHLKRGDGSIQGGQGPFCNPHRVEVVWRSVVQRAQVPVPSTDVLELDRMWEGSGEAAGRTERRPGRGRGREGEGGERGGKDVRGGTEGGRDREEERDVGGGMEGGRERGEGVT